MERYPTDVRENIIKELHYILMQAFPCPDEIASEDLNCESPYEVTVIDNYRIDDFQNTLYAAIRLLERMAYFERGLE